MKYNPAIDGVRALAAIAVVGFHVKFPGFQGGFLGVDVFFVLSGFLITALLRAELTQDGAIDLRHFYWRRFIRLFPPLMAALMGTVLLWSIFEPSADLLPDLLASLLYLSDYGVAFGIAPQYLKHTWSLSVEARFYLLWPLFLIVARRMSTTSLFRLVVVLFGAAMTWKGIDLFLWRDFSWTYYRADTRLSGILLGAAVALFPVQVSVRRAATLAIISSVLLAFCCALVPWGGSAALVLGGPVAELATAALLIALMSGQRTGVGAALAHPVLVHLGVLSYSIYLWHYGIALLVRTSLDPVISFPVTLVAAIALAQVTHSLIELPLRRWVRRPAQPSHA